MGLDVLFRLKTFVLEIRLLSECTYQVELFHCSVGFLGVFLYFCGFVGYKRDVVLAVLWWKRYLIRFS